MPQFKTFDEDLRDHIGRVQNKMSRFILKAKERAILHDESKRSPEEYDVYKEIFPELQTAKFGTPEYKAAVKKLGPALEHHHKHNRHHPEHFELMYSKKKGEGVTGMNLLDVLEMAADWVAASERGGNDPIDTMKNILFKKYGITGPLADILVNTVRDLLR